MVRHKVFLVANTSWYLYNFRLPLIRRLKTLGYNVELVAPYDKHTSLLQAEGYKIHCWNVRRSSVNPLSELQALFNLIRIYRSEQPALVHHFTIKACLYGTIAAKASRVYCVINAVTGLGHLFLARRKRSRLLRYFIKPVYQGTFNARRSTVVFQNAADQEKLIRLGITDSQRAQLIRGSGVDITYFNPATVPTASTPGSYHDPLRVLFPSRLIREKGTDELLTACRSLWADGVRLHLYVAGSIDTGNRSSLSESELTLLQCNPSIHLLGHVSDMRNLYSTSDLVVLPSWREGLSRSLIEAASMQRPIITTDVPGCRDVVDHGISGLLVPPRDPRSLELSIRLLLQHPSIAHAFGRQARKKVVNEFQVSLVNDRTVATYQKLLGSRTERKPFLGFLF